MGSHHWEVLWPSSICTGQIPQALTVATVAPFGLAVDGCQQLRAVGDHQSVIRGFDATPAQGFAGLLCLIGSTGAPGR